MFFNVHDEMDSWVFHIQTKLSLAGRVILVCSFVECNTALPDGKMDVHVEGIALDNLMGERQQHAFEPIKHKEQINILNHNMQIDDGTS